MTKTKQSNSIYDLGLHGKWVSGDGMMQVTRVPGGWIYESWKYVEGDYQPFSTVFVPFDNEFQE